MQERTPQAGAMMSHEDRRHGAVGAHAQRAR